MNFKSIVFSASVLMAGGVLAAASAISDVTVENGWPWQKQVKFAFTVGAGDQVDIGLSATWDGQSTPVDLVEAGAVLDFDPFNCHEGRHEGLLNLAKIGELGTQLKNFKLSVTPLAKTERMFLYVDVENGTNCWYATRPAQILGETENDAVSATYLKRGILFRRVLGGPVGSYTNGVASAIRTACKMWDCTTKNSPMGGGTAAASGWSTTDPQQIGFSSDYFISCSFITQAQFKRLGIGDSDSISVQKSTMNSLRGAANADPGSAGDVRWPTTGFYVNPDSSIAKMRAKLGSQLSAGWVVDLPTFTQLEIASRCGRNTIWWNGGDTTTTTDEALSNLVSVCTTWGRHNPKTHPGDYRFAASVPGQMVPNDWGLWEPNGGLMAIQLQGLDNKGTDAASYRGMDPVGVAYNGSLRIQGVGDADTWELVGTIPSRSYTGNFTSAYSFRLVLNTTNWPNKPLK